MFYVWMLTDFFSFGFCFFFFQAEDGIRDLVRSRGLGDVYKRQEIDPVPSAGCASASGVEVPQERRERAAGGLDRWYFLVAVSYTHLTLPTIYSV